MSSIKVATICPRMALCDRERNIKNLEGWSAKAKNAGADMAVFPEMFISGYLESFMIDAGYAHRETFLSMSEPTPGPTTRRLEKLSRELGIFICAGMLERDGQNNYNTQVMIDPAKGYVGRYRKVQIGGGEKWFCTPGDDWPVFDVLGVPTGVMLCRDKSHPEVARILALEGAQLLLVPHSTTDFAQMAFTTYSHRLCVGRAIENGCYVIANNNIYDCPMQGECRQAGYNMAIDPYGNTIHCDEGPGDEEKMALIDVDTAVVTQRRMREGLESFNLWTRRPQVYQRLVEDRGTSPGI